MTTNAWVLLCVILNTAALAAVVLLAAFSEVSNGTALALGALFVVASVLPFAKAKAAYVAAGHS